MLFTNHENLTTLKILLETKGGAWRILVICVFGLFCCFTLVFPVNGVRWGRAGGEGEGISKEFLREKNLTLYFSDHLKCHP